MNHHFNFAYPLPAACITLFVFTVYNYLFCWFQANGEEALRSLSTKLTENKVDHKLWIEQPENIPTCIATKPYPKSEIQSYFKKFKLFK